MQEHGSSDGPDFLAKHAQREDNKELRSDAFSLSFSRSGGDEGV